LIYCRRVHTSGRAPHFQVARISQVTASCLRRLEQFLAKVIEHSGPVPGIADCERTRGLRIIHGQMAIELLRTPLRASLIAIGIGRPWTRHPLNGAGSCEEDGADQAYGCRCVPRQG
jgi:hypothetical protein